MYCFLLFIFMFQLSSTSTLGLHTNPVSTSNAIQDPVDASEIHWVPRYTRGVVGHLPSNAYESGSGLGKTYLTFYGNLFNFFLLVAEFSA
jgi:hypothetical protein